jgi:hypothetical protein
MSLIQERFGNDKQEIQSRVLYSPIPAAAGPACWTLARQSRACGYRTATVNWPMSCWAIRIWPVISVALTRAMGRRSAA